MHDRLRPARACASVVLAVLAGAVASATVTPGPPLVFEPNVGQTAAEARYLSRGPAGTLLVASDRFLLAAPATGGGWAAVALVLDVPPSGGPSARRPLRSHSNYFIGDEPGEWRTDVRHFAEVAYEGAAPGIDVVLHGRGGGLEYDVVVHPGADPAALALRVDGARCLEVDGAGDLVLETRAGSLRHARPVAYQDLAGGRRRVEASFRVDGDRLLFDVGAYDRAATLVIDPVIAYGTYLGGSLDETATSVVVDAAGDIYVAGETGSIDFPTLNAFQGTFGGGGSPNGDGFVTKLRGDGTALLFSTYIGGNALDTLNNKIAVDAGGAVYVSGTTDSTNFPTVNPIQTDRFGRDAWVAKLAPAGNALVYSTYLGGVSNGAEDARGVAIDGSGRCWVTGLTSSTTWPLVNPIQSANGGAYAVFITRINAAGTAYDFSTYLGGNNTSAGQDIFVDASGDAYITGDTDATNFPVTASAYQSTRAGGFDVFVARITSAGTLAYASYLGGSGGDVGLSIWASGGVAWIAGYTASGNFPVAGAIQPVYGGGSQDGIVATFDTAQSGAASLLQSTFLGGNGTDYAYGVAIDAAARISVAGSTASTNFPLVAALETTLTGTLDGFVTRLAPGGGTMLFSSYIGGAGFDAAYGIVVDPAGHPAVVGSTASVTGFPVTFDAYDAACGTTANCNGGRYDLWLVRYTEPLMASKSAGGVALRFPKRAGATGYNVYTGNLGTYYVPAWTLCGQAPAVDHGDGTATIDLGAVSGDVWFLVTASTGVYESTLGADSAGVARDPAPPEPWRCGP